MTVVKNTPFRKEYVTGMKDLFDLMWDVEENAYRQTKSKEEYHEKLIEELLDSYENVQRS